MNSEVDNTILTVTWTYRSFVHDPVLSTPFNDLEFGRANLRIDPAPMHVFKGLIYGINQRPAITGSIVRTVPHSASDGNVAPAGVVCSWIAVKQDPAS